MKAHSRSGAITYFQRNGFSINEGGRYANVTMRWNYLGARIFFYIYLFGWRWNLWLPIKKSEKH